MNLRQITAFVCVLVWIQPLAADAQNSQPNALYLNGSRGYVTLPGYLTRGLTEATVEAWVRWESFNTWSRVFDFGQENNAAVLQNEKDKSTLYFAIYNRQGKRNRIKSKYRATQGEWIHLAAIVSKTLGLQLYVNGHLAAQMKSSTTLDDIGGGNNFIGKSNWPDDGLFHGYLAELRIWKKVRSPQEIQTHMSTQLTAEEVGLLGYWRFDRANGNGISDLTGNGFDATLMDGAELQPVSGLQLKKVQTGSEKRQTAWNDLFQKGQQALESGNLTQAIETLSRIGKGSGQYEEARKLISTAKKKQVQSLATTLLEGQQAFNRGDWETAIASLSKLQSTDPGYALAQELLQKARGNQKKQASEAAALRRGKQALARGQFDTAASHLTQVPKGSSSYTEAQTLLQEARSQKQTQTHGPLYDQGKAAAQNGEYEQAITLLAQIPKTFPQYADAQAVIADAKATIKTIRETYVGTWESRPPSEGIWWRLVVQTDSVWLLYSALNPDSDAAKLMGGEFSWGDPTSKGHLTLAQTEIHLAQKRGDKNQTLYRCLLAEGTLTATYRTGNPIIRMTKAVP